MPDDDIDEAEDLEPARTVCIEIIATTEAGEALLDKVAAELGAILEAAAKQYAYPAGIEYDQMAVVDPAEADGPEFAD